MRHRSWSLPWDPALPAWVRQVGHITESDGVPTWRRLDRDASILSVVYRGRGWFEDGRGRQEVVDGSVIHVTPGNRHRYAPDPGAPWDEVYVVCGGTDLDAWSRCGLLPPERSLWRMDDAAAWGKRMLGFVERYARRPRPPVVVASAWLALLAELVTGGEAPGDERWLAAAGAALDCEDLAAAAPLPAVAADLGMGYEAFRKRFARLAGESPGRYRARRVLDRVAAALLEEDATLEQLATRHGFCDAFHLSRRFKRLYGSSPLAFRRQARR